MSEHGSQESLRRHLRFFDVYALSVGSVIGTGIFFLPGKAAMAMGNSVDNFNVYSNFETLKLCVQTAITFIDDV